MQQRIGPENPGLSRFFAARIMLVLTAGFYIAGLVFVFMYSMGYDPTAHPITFGGHVNWPWDWWSD